MATATLARTGVSRRKKWLWTLLLLLSAGVLAAAALGASFYFLTRASLPQLDGVIKVSGLRAPVTIIRDHYGVPHIRAENMDDLLFAQGYVTAQDRLWQMDVSRRFAAGELAEVLGVAFVKSDRQERILSLRQVAERSAAHLTSVERQQLEAYVRGVNAYIEDHRQNLPIEFRVLRYAPRPWTVTDSFLVGASMAQFLNHELFDTELVREKIEARIGSALAADIYPNRSPRDHLPGASTKPVPSRTAQAEAGAGNSILRTNVVDNEETDLVPGSNNWVVSGAHTVSGKPMLSNDMHLVHHIPNTWYEAHLTAGDFDVAGVTLPGTPFVIVGHNRRIAWGFTNLGPDVEDIFIETFNNRGEYRTPAGWKFPERRREVIHVRSGKDVEIEVVTTRHGPIATELVPGETRPLALQWTLYDAEALTFPFGEINAATNWQEFRRAFSHFRAPGQNVVYADIDGHIGYQATGAIPIRASGDGALPVSGSDDAHEWVGYLPFEELPQVFDPPSGVLATANGRIVPEGYRPVLSNEWGPPYRTERIYALLASKSRLSAEDMLAFQNDVYSELDQMCAQRFAAAIGGSTNASQRAREAANLLRSWDGRFTKDSAAATLVTVARRHLMRMLLEPKLGATLAKEYTWYSSSVVIENLLSTQPKQWLPADSASYDELLARALESALAQSDAPRDVNSWRRGPAFPLEIQHPLFGMVPFLAHWTGPGIVEQSGSGLTVKQVGRKFGPSERMTVDFGDLDASTLNIVTGQSGNFLSPHYMDQWSLWYEGRTKVLPFSNKAVERAGSHTLTLESK